MCLFLTLRSSHMYAGVGMCVSIYSLSAAFASSLFALYVLVLFLLPSVCHLSSVHVVPFGLLQQRLPALSVWWWCGCLCSAAAAVFFPIACY